MSAYKEVVVSLSRAGYEALENAAILQGLSSDDVANLALQMYVQIISMPPGKVMYWEGAHKERIMLHKHNPDEDWPD